jgi:single-strand DNA-binding protein
VSRSLNKVTLIGNVGADPEIRATPAGGRVAQLSIATSRAWNDASGVKQEKTEWHRCVVWNSKSSSLVELIERYVKKGDKLYVEGRIEYRQWQDKEGQTRYATDINVRELILLGGRRDAGEDESSVGGAPPRRATAAGATAANGRNGSAASNDDFADFPGALEEEHDDLPF